MNKARSLVWLSSTLTAAMLLSSCGGGTKKNYISCPTLNSKGEYRINNIKVIEANLPVEDNFHNFTFREGYDISSVLLALKKQNDWYELYEDNVFITTIIDDKIHYFLIKYSNTSVKDTNTIWNLSVNYYESENSKRQSLLLPYIALKNKSQIREMKDFFYYTDDTTIPIYFETSLEYKDIKLYYYLTAQTEIEYDDENNEIIFFDKMHLKIENGRFSLFESL